jgi:KaiC/GvpD/RAD55 family RecA-like ATPase
MAAFNKFNSFVEALAEGYHNLGSDVLKIMLTDTLPVATDLDTADIIEIDEVNGYAAGGIVINNVSSTQTDGVYKLVLADATLSAFGGDIGPFRFAVIYNSDNDLLIGWADYGEELTLLNGNSLVFDFDQVLGVIQIGSGGGQAETLATPTNFEVQIASPSALQLIWDAVTGANNYIIERSVDGVTSWTVIYMDDVVGFTDSGLSAATLYYYRIHCTGSGYFDSDYAYLTGTTSSATIPLDEAILILQVGQSNAVGRADADPAHEVAVPDGVYEYKPNINDILPLADPTGMVGDNSRATVRSMNPNLGKILVEGLNKAVIIIPAAVGNTSIVTWINTSSSLYTTALSRWNAAKAFCAANGITIIGAYAHWLQGENDAGAMDTDTYLVNLNTMVDLLTENFSIDKVFATRIGYDPNYTSAANSEKIMNAIKLLNYSKDSLIVDSFAPSTFTTGNSKMKSDGVHYTVIGLNETGEDVADSVINYRSNNKKTILTENVTALQDPVGYYDDIYLFRSLTPLLNNTGYKELFDRNNLTLSSGSPNYNGIYGLTIPGSTPLTPATVRTLTNTHDWSIDVTFRMDGISSGMLITGRSSGNWANDWLWISGASSIQLNGNGVTKTVSLTGANFNQLSNLVITYAYLTNTVNVYYNSVLKSTFTDWVFSSFRLESIARGYQTTPTTEIFKGVIERVRIVKKTLASWEFDRSPNFTVSPSYDWQFDFNGTINELNGDVSTAMKLYTTNADTLPVFDANGLVFDQSAYLRFGQQLELSGDFIIEFRLKDTTGTGQKDIARGGTTPGNPAGSIINLDGSPHSLFYLYTPTGTTNWALGSGFVTTTFHTYKIVQNTTASTLELFIDGVSKGTKAIKTGFTLSTLGGGNPQSTGLIGTIDYFNVKNSI